MAVRSAGSPSSASIVGLNIKTAVRAATTATLASSPTYSNGVLTAGSSTSLAAQDGVSLAVGERLLVKDQSSSLQNGIYSVTSLGLSSFSPYVLTRSGDMDTWSEVPSSVCIVQEGSTLADTSWLCTSNEGGTLGSTAISFARFGSPTSLWT